MPIYEYRCKKCEKEFEELIREKKEGTIKCPKCGSSETQKLLSGFGVSGVSGGNTCSTTCGGGTCGTCG